MRLGLAFLTGIPLTVRRPKDLTVPNCRRAVCGPGSQRPPAGEGAVPAARGAGRGGAPRGQQLPASAPAPASDPAPVTRGGAPPAQRSQPMAPSRMQLGIRAAYSGLSAVAGFSIFLVWTVVYSQPATAAMGGLAGTPRRPGRWGPTAGMRAWGGAVSCSGGSSRAAHPWGAGGVFTQKHPLAAQARRGLGILRVPPGPDASRALARSRVPTSGWGCLPKSAAPPPLPGLARGPSALLPITASSLRARFACHLPTLLHI